MSDVMLYGVLRMPYEMAMSEEYSRRQFYDRAQEALDRLEAAERKIAGMRTVHRLTAEESAAILERQLAADEREYGGDYAAAIRKGG